MITFDSNLLLGYYQAKAGLGGAVSAGGNLLGPQKQAPTAPWSGGQAPEPSELVRNALAGRNFVDVNAAKLDVKGASDDYKTLFALHSGLASLEALARRADEEGLPPGELKRIQEAFARGTAEVSTAIEGAKFENLRLTHGEASDKAKMSVGVQKSYPNYTTPPLHSGQADTAVEAFQGDVKFEMKVRRLNNTYVTVNFDLAEMGSATRSMNSVVKYMNDKLAAADVSTRMSVERIKGEAKEVEVNGRKVKVASAVDSFALKIQGDTTERLTFSALATAPAVYVTQTVGDPDPDNKATTDDAVLQQQMLKLETGSDPTADAVRRPDDANWVAGRVFGNTLPEEVESVGKSIAGPDGAIYMLADVTGAVDDQTIKGSKDVALLKYDSAGKLVYSRTLGAAESATGLGLTVSADGKVAISGSVSGGLLTDPNVGTASEGGTKSFAGQETGKSDSFVTVFDKDGQEMWTQRTGTRDDDEAVAVAFGADGSLYALGRTKGAVLGASSAGGWDTTLRSYSADGKLMSSTQFGASGDDKPAGLVVSGDTVVVATVEAGAAKLRSFDFTNPAKPVEGASRDLGMLGGGSIAGIALQGGSIVIAGATGATLNVGAATRPYADATEAFAARVDLSLTPGANDVVAYYGGAGDDRATAFALADGKVWLTGASKGALPSGDKIGEVDGFVVGLDLDSGEAVYEQRFSGKDGFATPTTIAVDASGASVLDRLGLPKGEIAYTDSQRITAATAARDGDQFQIRTRPGARPVTVTIADDDTLDTLAQKVRRATGFSVRVDIVSDGQNRRLQIKPQNERSTIEILGGRGGRDALEALGLQEGFVRTTEITDEGKIVPKDGGDPMYSLRLARDLSISSKDAIKTTIDELTLAMTELRKAYREMTSVDAPQQKGKNADGQPPAYLTNQIANYQAALDRLTGGAG